jgi:DNA repair protein RadD
MASILRPHQVRLLAQINNAIADGCRRLIGQAPTGYGKTLLAAKILRDYQDFGGRGLFIAPALSLIDQTVEKLYAEGVRDVGVIQANHHMTDYSRPIQVASVQTLQRRGVPDSDIIIIDEVHKWFEVYPKILRDPRFADVPIIGLSATPWRKGLGKHFTRLEIGATIQELIDTGYLSLFRIFAPASPDLSQVHIVAGDFHEEELSSVMNKRELVADVVTEWLRRAEFRSTLCFAVDRAHAKHLQQQFLEAEVPAKYIDAYTPAAERNEIAQKFHDGILKVICNVGCLTTGIDWDVRAIILARPTRSEMLFVQMIGRGLRTAEGKADCLILDHSDNHLRLGFVTDIHHDHLDDGKEPARAKPTDRELLPKKCPQCAFVRPAGVNECPNCGFIAKRQPGAVHVDGDLVEFKTRTERVGPSIAEQQEFYAELKRIQETRGYQTGWTAHKYREKFGAWPPPHFRNLPSRTPTEATQRWVRSRDIAWAKGPRRRGAA